MGKTVKNLALAAIAAAAVLSVFFLFLYLKTPPIQEQLPESTLVVTITSPQMGMVLLQGGPYTVRAEVVGPQGVIEVELWANGSLVGVSEAAPTGGYSYQAKWNWTIASPGQKTLFARATDEKGQVVVSSPILMTALATDTGVVMETYLAEEGDTLAEIAAENELPLEDLADYNSIPDSHTPLDEGTKVYIPAGNPSSSPADQPAPQDQISAPEPDADNISPAPNAPNPSWLWVRGFLNSPENLPSAPLLSGEAVGCLASLLIGDQSNNEQGFVVYRYHPNISLWTAIDPIGAHSGEGTLTYLDETPLSQDGALYMVEAFNAVGKAASVPVEITPADPQNCEQNGWEGIPIVNGVLALAPVYDQVYLYLSVGNGQFGRIPADKDVFLPAVENGYDLKPYLKDASLIGEFDQVQIVYEVWGWQGGSLIRIGAGGAEKAASQDMPLAVSSGKLEISFIGTFSDVSPGSEEANIRPEPWELSWYGNSLPSIEGRVQVSLSPFPSSPDLNPPGLIAEKEVDLGLFELNFSEILAVETGEEGPATRPLEVNPSGGTAAGNPVGVGTYPGALPEQESPGQVGAQGIQAGALNVGPVNEAFLGSFPLDLYIRVVPLQNGKVAGQPTNTVIAHYIPPDPNAEEFEFIAPTHIDPIYQTKIVEFVPPDFEDPNRWGCVVVKGYNSSASSGDKEDYPVGREICPPSYKGGSNPSLIELATDLFNGFKDLFNFVTGLYNDLKASVIELALDILPCGGLESVCKTIVSAAVDYGLAAVGLPPSLPNFDQFADAAKGEMVDLIVEEAAAQSPVPCPDVCQEQLHNAIEQTIDTALDEMEKLSVAPSCVSEDEAHAHGSEPWCPPPGVIVKPALGATDQPASAVIEVTLLPDKVVPPDYPECRISAAVRVSKFFEAQTWNGAGGWLKYPIEAQTVRMQPYYSDHFTVSGLAPGEAARFVVVFDETIPYYYLPWTLDMYRGSQIAPNWKRDWYAVVRHGNATLSTSANLYKGMGNYTETSACATSDELQFIVP